MTDLLAGAKAKVVANTSLFFEPQIDAGFGYITRLSELQNQMLAAGFESPQLIEMGGLLREAEVKLNTDLTLGESMARSGSVLLPMLFSRRAAWPPGPAVT